MSTWRNSTEPYRDVPQNGLPHMHWPGGAEQDLAPMTMMCGGVGLHFVSTQEHSCGTTPWQANPRAPVQHCMPRAERLCMAECVILCGSVVANW